MREILFRGKNAKGEWEYGVPFISESGEFANMAQMHSYNVRIDPKTIGQYTGLTDKNGSKIFEGDIIAHFVNWLGKRVNGVCKYNNKDASYSCYFDIDSEPKCAFLADWVDGNGAEIIGNVWDNPELLQNT